MALNDPAVEVLTRVYQDLDARLRQALLTATADSWDWRRCQALLEQVAAQLARLNVYVDDWDGRQLRLASEDGRRRADEHLAAQGIRLSQAEDAAWNRLNSEGLNTLSKAVAGHRQQFVSAILRRSTDYLRELTAGELGAGLGLGKGALDVGRAIRDGSIARLQGGQAIQDLAGRMDAAAGVVYTDGSVHSLHAYGEMSARTGMMAALNESSALRYRSAGVHLYKVSSHGTLCWMCAPYEGMVFAFDAEGEALGYPLMNRPIPLHPNCFPAGVLVHGPRATAASARWYEGELVILSTAGGVQLPVTPNHPILTPEGWIAARALKEGDCVLRSGRHQGMLETINPDEELVPARIEDVARALIESLEVPSVRVPVSAEDFHGDGIGSQVCVIAADGLLRNGLNPGAGEPFCHLDLCRAFVSDTDLPGGGDLLAMAIRLGGIANRGMGGGRECLPFLWSHPGHPGPDGLRPGLFRDSVFSEALLDNAKVDTQGVGDSLLSLAGLVSPDDLGDVEGNSPHTPGFVIGAPCYSGSIQAVSDHLVRNAERDGETLRATAGEIFADKIVHVEHVRFSGHVHNLQTTAGWYAANSIITHNCRHTLGPYLPAAFGPGEKIDPSLLSASDRELYAHFRDDVPEGKEMLAAARNGWRNQKEWRARAPGQEHGPRWHQAGIEARRIEATKRVLASGGKLNYQQAMGQIQGERMKAEGKGIFAPKIPPVLEPKKAEPPPKYPDLHPALQGLSGDALSIWGSPIIREEALRDIVQAFDAGDMDRLRVATKRVDDAAAAGMQELGFARTPPRSVTVQPPDVMGGDRGSKSDSCDIRIGVEWIRESLDSSHTPGNAFRTWVHESHHSRLPFDSDWRTELFSKAGYEEGLTEGVARHIMDLANIPHNSGVYNRYVSTYEHVAAQIGVEPAELYAKVRVRAVGGVRRGFADDVSELYEKVHGVPFTDSQKSNLMHDVDFEMLVGRG